jgi:hypothetical protein
LCELKLRERNWHNISPQRSKKFEIRFGGFYTVVLVTAMCEYCQVTMGPTILRGFCKKFFELKFTVNKWHPDVGAQNVLKLTWLFN